jgi:hypothetical protein
MRRLILLFLLLSACAPPVINWPETEAPSTPPLLPGASLIPPQGSTDPGPALDARATALRTGLGL